MIIPWRRFLIPCCLIPVTEELIRSYWDGDQPREGLVYWGGRRAGRDIAALSVFAPSASAESLSVETSEDSNAEFIRALHDHSLMYVTQVHSHPPGVVGHSPGDDQWAFMRHEGLVSIVVQDYGKEPMWPLKAVYVYSGGRFFRLSQETIQERFLLVPSSVNLKRGQTTHD